MIHTAPAFAAAASLCCWLLGENWGIPRGKTKQKRRENTRNGRKKRIAKQKNTVYNDK